MRTHLKKNKRKLLKIFHHNEMQLKNKIAIHYNASEIFEFLQNSDFYI